MTSTDQPAGPALTITSFGYSHQPGEIAPHAHLTLDLRAHFKDPHVDPAMREMTGRDQEVITAVLSTPGIPALIAATLAAARAFCSGPSAGPLHIAAGCVGGRHRSYVVASALGTLLADLDPAVVHLHVDRPVICLPKPQS
ncbi:RapZ C-terminal domain-containing protein [Streptomyces virginiae]|uniref:RapZ C-terminal domain-containing protein n=1 Tax=Streptomyces virginiae TaxID=1961 RepID=UPI0032529A83